MDELLACPFCGERQADYQDSQESVFCHECGTVGPSGSTQADAERLWNKRALLALKDEGCTPVDIAVLRKANLDFACENQRLRQALRFYAQGKHIDLDRKLFDSVSGEPSNWRYRGEEGYEDGSVAKMALTGKTIEWGGEEPMPVEGEPEYDAVQQGLKDEGFVRRPVEPTKEMIAAGERAYGQGFSRKHLEATGDTLNEAIASYVYKAMLAAYKP